MAMKAILEVQPEAAFIQSESSEYYHPMNPGAKKAAFFLNEKSFLSLDLTYGYPMSAMMYEYLLDNGMTRDEYHWFGNNQTDDFFRYTSITLFFKIAVSHVRSELRP